MKIEEIDLSYIFDYVSWSNDCTCGDDYCRCQEILDPEITNYENSKLVNIIISDIYNPNTPQGQRNNKLSKILNNQIIVEYAIHRIVSLGNIKNGDDDWDFNIEWGYYGQEMTSINLCPSVARPLSEKIDKILSLKTTKEIIDYSMELEYGSLSKDSMRCKDYKVIKISHSELDNKSINENHLNKIERGLYSDYPKNLPRGIVKKNSRGYVIVDGYHRIFDVPSNKEFMVYSMKF